MLRLYIQILLTFCLVELVGLGRIGLDLTTSEKRIIEIYYALVNP